MEGLVKPSEIIRGYTQPIYDWVFLHLRELFIIVTIVLLFRIMLKLRKSIIAKKYRHKNAGSTNDWFSWEKFKEWKDNRQHETNSQ